MDDTCEFAREYVPSESVADTIYSTHLRNCVDCQSQVSITVDVLEA